MLTLRAPTLGLVLFRLGDMGRPGSLLKRDLAYKHFLDAQTAISEFLDSRPYEIASDEESEPGNLLFWITLRQEPPREIALWAGEAIHNLRSALDHIVYEISSKREPRPTRTGFPILIEETGWDRKDKRGKIRVDSGLHQVRLLPDKAVAIIRDLQPWPRPEPFWPDLFGPNRKRLEELHSLNVAAKHKNLNLAVSCVDIVGSGTKPSQGLKIEHVYRGLLQPDTRTLLFGFVDPSNAYEEFLPQLDVVFSEGPAPEEPVLHKLGELFRNTDMVINVLSPFT